MAGNPVFTNFEKNLRRGQYAGFDTGQGRTATPYQTSYPGPGSAGQAYVPQQPPATRSMTLEDVVRKALVLFGLLLVVAAAAWVVAQRAIDGGQGSVALGLWAGGGVVAFVLALVIGFKKTISVPLIVLYTVAEGAFLGAVSVFFNSAYSGVVGQAILATLCVFGGVLLGYRSGLIRVTSRSRRIFSYLVAGYLLFALVNLGLLLSGSQSGWGIGGSGPLGIAISLFAVVLASYSLATAFDSIEHGVRAGVPEKTSWLLAYGLMVSVAWLYVEMLRLLGRARD